MPHRLPRLIQNIADADTVSKVLDALNEHAGPLRVMSAWHVQVPTSTAPNEVFESFDQIVRDRLVTVHSDISARFWQDFKSAVKDYGLSRMNFLARNSPASFTFSEGRRQLNPVGHEQWIWDALQDHAFRDGFITRHDGWVVTFWSPGVLNETKLKSETRLVLDLSAAAAAHRLNQIVLPKRKKIRHVELSSRELAALGHLARGLRVPAIAKHMEIGERSVREYLQRGQRKLGAVTTTHAVVIAVRRRLI